MATYHSDELLTFCGDIWLLVESRDAISEKSMVLSLKGPGTRVKEISRMPSEIRVQPCRPPSRTFF